MLVIVVIEMPIMSTNFYKITIFELPYNYFKERNFRWKKIFADLLYLAKNTKSNSLFISKKAEMKKLILAKFFHISHNTKQFLCFISIFFFIFYENCNVKTAKIDIGGLWRPSKVGELWEAPSYLFGTIKSDHY